MTYEQYLMHHGIMGQKWGVRRYQNPDGSLTAAGRERYLKAGGGLTEEGKKYFSKGPSRAQKKAYKKAAREAYNQGHETFYNSEKGKSLLKKRTDLENEQEEEFYKDPDAFDYGNGTKRSQQIDKEIAAINKQYDDGLDRAIVEELLKTYSSQEIRWLEKNTFIGGRRASMKILSEYEKMSVSDIKNAGKNNSQAPKSSQNGKTQTPKPNQNSTDLFVGDKMNANNPNDTDVTRQVKQDYNDLSDDEFMQKYYTSRSEYRKRVEKYGDPYARRKR